MVDWLKYLKSPSSKPKPKYNTCSTIQHYWNTTSTRHSVFAQPPDMY